MGTESLALRWGILGTGNIAKQFVGDVKDGEKHEVVAVGSRREASAVGFAEKFGIERAHGSYEGLLGDAGVEAVYVSLPNSMHHEWSIKAMEAGKHVLCEKPIAVTVAEAEEMFDVSQKVGRVLVEGFMYRSHPQTKVLIEHLKDGVIGDVRMVHASFCYHTNKPGGNIRFDPGLAGGALMDVGCYAVNFARLIAREVNGAAEPSRMSGSMRMHELGVDELFVGAMGFEDGMQATLVGGMCAQTDNAALVCGDAGYVRVPVPWKPPGDAHFLIEGMTPPKMDLPEGERGGGTGVTQPPPRGKVEITEAMGNGLPLFRYEADDFYATVREGAAAVVSRADSVGNTAALVEFGKLRG